MIKLDEKMKRKLAAYYSFLFLFLATTSIAQTNTIRVDSVYSPSVELTLKYTVILPENYEEDTTTNYPIMYLLHGHTGNYTSWLTYAEFDPEWATDFQTIVVLPDGGNSWYVNWSGQTDDKPHRWEDMLVKDLLPDVTQKYRTTNTKETTSIGGLSMGGYGALAVGLRNPALFGAIFSVSGAIDFSKNIQNEFERDTLDWNSPMLWSNGDKVIDVSGFSTQKERTPKGLVFKNTKLALEYDPYLLLGSIKPKQMPYLMIVCGLEDDFIKDARNYKNFMGVHVKKYAYIEMPGAHEVPFWQNALELIFPMLEHNRKPILGNGQE